MTSRDLASERARPIVVSQAIAGGPLGIRDGDYAYPGVVYGIDTIKVFQRCQRPPAMPWSRESKVYRAKDDKDLFMRKWVAIGHGFQMEYAAFYDNPCVLFPEDRSAIFGMLRCQASLPKILFGHNALPISGPAQAAEAIAALDQRVYVFTGQTTNLAWWQLSRVDVTSDRVLRSSEDVRTILDRLAVMTIRGKPASRWKNGVLWEAGRNAVSHTAYDKHAESLRDIAIGRLRVESRAKGHGCIKKCFPANPEFQTICLGHLSHPSAEVAMRRLAEPVVRLVDYAMKEGPKTMEEVYEQLCRGGIGRRQIATILGVLMEVEFFGWEACITRGLFSRSSMYKYQAIFRKYGIRPEGIQLR